MLAEREEECLPRWKPPSLHAIAHAVELHEGVGMEALRSGTRVRAVSKARKIFTLVARGLGHVVKDVAIYLSVDGASVSGYEIDLTKLSEDVRRIKGQVKKT